MRGYKINKEGIIEGVYDKAPEGSLNNYTGSAGDYTETAINKLITQSVRYSEYIRLKTERERIEVELEDTQSELTRKVNDDRNNRETISKLEQDINQRQSKSEALRQELESIKSEIDNVLGGVQ